MNLGEFIGHRSHCPLCGTALVTGFHSNRKQSISYEENRASISFKLDGLNQFQKEYVYHNVAPAFLIDRFKELHKNLKIFRFYRGCTSCEEYAYGSKQFDIN